MPTQVVSIPCLDGSVRSLELSSKLLVSRGPEAFVPGVWAVFWYHDLNSVASSLYYLTDPKTSPEGTNCWINGHHEHFLFGEMGGWLDFVINPWTGEPE